MASDRGSEALCRDLLQMALDRGGEDNVTVLAAGRRKSSRPDRMEIECVALMIPRGSGPTATP